MHIPIDNNNTWTLKIPSGISGEFVLRHEIIALHSAGTVDGAQNYPMCLNLKISGSGNQQPCTSGADCKHGVSKSLAYSFGRDTRDEIVG